MKSGEISPSEVETAFGAIAWESLNGRARVVEDGAGKALEVLFPKGGVGSRESGAQFVVEIPSSRVTVLRYRVRPEPGFAFVKGGKLPGLASGGSRFTGGRPPGKEGGWSARYMWRGEGALELYFYHPGMKEQFGERHPLGVKLIPGEWTELTQRIDTGDPGKRNGSIRIEVEGEKKLQIDELEFHGSRYGKTDAFLFHTFYGGSSKSWAPREETRLQFDDFEISPEDGEAKKD